MNFKQIQRTQACVPVHTRLIAGAGITMTGYAACNYAADLTIKNLEGFMVGFIVGVFVGTFFGIFIMGLLAVAAAVDQTARVRMLALPLPRPGCRPRTWRDNC